MGHLDKNEINKIEILTGSFIFIRKSVLDQIGLFDETFFMYGEDVDLSYRILKAGYANYYFPKTTIIHYRGESTKKGSINYVLVFYRAMKIFTQKHFSNNQAILFSLLINLAINFRAILSIIKRTFIHVLPIIIDLVTFYLVVIAAMGFWEKIYLQETHYYPSRYKNLLIPMYVLLWVISLYVAKVYRHPIKIKTVIKGVSIGTILNLVAYALVPTSFRFSRAVLLIGACAIFIVAIVNRYLLHLTGIKEYSLILKNNKRFAIVGYNGEAERVKNILIKSGIVPEHIEFVLPREGETHADYSCTIAQLSEIVEMQSIDEVIFCSNDISMEVIIKNMKLLSKAKIDFKIASPESLSVVGSNSTKASGDLYVIKIDDFKN
jgi:hypothetical protein